jgi:signal transduction histidine kinase
MTVILRNTGARRGFLLRAEGEEIRVEASGSADGEEITVAEGTPLEAREDLPRSIVRYVHRAQEMVHLGDSCRQGSFAADPYLTREQPRSILCLPILRRERPVAILYLENDRLRDAFSEDRVAAVQLICSQTAVALENARLHADLHRALRDLEKKNAELEARNVDLARLNYTVSHDLQNPLVTIRNFLGLLRQNLNAGKTERLAGDLDRLETAAVRLQRLLAELFELSRLDHRSGPVEEVVFSELAREALDHFAEAIAERGVEVRVAPNLPVVTGERTRLLEAVRHLLENALGFLGDQRQPRIEVGGRTGAEEATLYVRDNGVGIDPRYHEKVFELFERLDPPASEGTGVGLALVKRIVEVHGGRIWIESEGVGKGSTFCFTLPRAAPAS